MIIEVAGYECTIFEITKLLLNIHEWKEKNIVKNIISISMSYNLDENLRNLRKIKGTTKKYHISDVESNNLDYYLKVEKDF